mgnify:FL=1
MSFDDFTVLPDTTAAQSMNFHSFVARLWSLAALGLLGLTATGAGAAAPAHEAVIQAVADTPSNRAYTVCVKQRAAGDGQCVWTLRVEEDVAGALMSRPFAALASDDGLRVAVVLRKKHNDRVIDELWRYHQQMNPDMAVPGTPSNRALVTRSRLIATGYPLSYSGNLALNRFVVNDGRKLQAIDDRGNTLATLYEAERGRSLDLVARRGALSGYTEGTDGNFQRLVVADLDGLDVQTYATHGIDQRNEIAWNLERAWVATTDFPATDTAALQAREHVGTPTTLRVTDLAFHRAVFQATRANGPMQPAWADADTLVWRTDDTHTQSQQFDEHAEVRLLQATIRAQGDRLMFLPCRERNVLLIDDAASAPEAITALRQQLARTDHVFIEAFGVRAGGGVALDTLVQTGTDQNGCQLRADRALLEAGGSNPEWKLALTPDGVKLDVAGQPSLQARGAHLRRLDAKRAVTVRSPGFDLDLTATPQACRDPATGMTQGWRATLKYGAPNQPARELRGCARVLFPGIDAARSNAMR